MNKILVLFASLLFFISCGNTATEDACIKIYEDGIKEINVAKSHKELSDISYKVNVQIMKIAEGPAGEEAMSEKGSQELQNAQQKFFRAIEHRGRQLMPQ